MADAPTSPFSKGNSAANPWQTPTQYNNFGFSAPLYFRWWALPAEKRKKPFTEAASLPARQQSENTGPSLFGYIFGAASHLEY